MTDEEFQAIVSALRASAGIAAKRDIAVATQQLSLAGRPIAVGDDCAAIADADGFLLLAIEGFMNEFVAGDPWFSGWCGVMVNLSDIAAMGDAARLLLGGSAHEYTSIIVASISNAARFSRLIPSHSASPSSAATPT